MSSYRCSLCQTSIQSSGILQFCAVCQGIVCGNCSKTHIHKDQNQELNEAGGSTHSQLYCCDRHRNEPLTDYCETHSEILCKVCKQHHDNCTDVKSIEDACQGVCESEEAGHILQNLENVKNKLKFSEVCRNKDLKNLTDDRDNALKQKRKQRYKINEEFDRLEQKLEKEISETFRTHLHPITEHVSKLESEVKAVEEYIKILSESLSSGNDKKLFLAMQGKQLKKSQEFLEDVQRNSKSAKISFQPDYKILTQLKKIKKMGKLTTNTQPQTQLSGTKTHTSTKPQTSTSDNGCCTDMPHEEQQSDSEVPTVVVADPQSPLVTYPTIIQSENTASTEHYTNIMPRIQQSDPGHSTRKHDSISQLRPEYPVSNQSDALQIDPVYPANIQLIGQQSDAGQHTVMQTDTSNSIPTRRLSPGFEPSTRTASVPSEQLTLTLPVAVLHQNQNFDNIRTDSNSGFFPNDQSGQPIDRQLNPVISTLTHKDVPHSMSRLSPQCVQTETAQANQRSSTAVQLNPQQGHLRCNGTLQTGPRSSNRIGQVTLLSPQQSVLNCQLGLLHSVPGNSGSPISQLHSRSSDINIYPGVIDSSSTLSSPQGSSNRFQSSTLVSSISNLSGPGNTVVMDSGVQHLHLTSISSNCIQSSPLGSSHRFQPYPVRSSPHQPVRVQSVQDDLSSDFLGSRQSRPSCVSNVQTIQPLLNSVTTSNTRITTPWPDLVNIYNQPVFHQQSSRYNQLTGDLKDRQIIKVGKYSVQEDDDVDDDDSWISGAIFLEDNSLLVCDMVNQKIKHLNSDMTLLSSIELPSKPWDITLVSQQEAVITMPDEHQLQYLTVTPRLKLGRTVPVDRECSGVTFHRNNLYVACRFSREVLVMDHTGNTVRRYRVNDNVMPYYVAVGDDGIVYVSDFIAHTVTAFNPEGDTVYQYKNNNMRDPRQLLVDNTGYVYVSGMCSNNIQIITPEGQMYKELVKVGEGPICPMSIAYRASDKTLFLGCFQDESQVYRFV